jgi:hypothetical protein
MRAVTIVAVTAIAVSSAFLCGCAATPESIIPSYVSTLTYSNLSCQQLGEEEARVSAAYTVAAGQQNSARTNDTVGILLLGLPVGSMTGENVAPEVANLKGQANAIHEVETRKNCNATPPVAAGTHPYVNPQPSGSPGT